MRKRILKVAVVVFAVGVLFCGVALGAVFWHIHQTVEKNCRIAQQAHPHPGDDVTALVDFMNSPSHSLWDRTHIGIWTLGQMSDPKALPALEAASRSVPLVVSSAPSLGEIFGRAALLVPSHDETAIAESLDRVLTEPPLRATLIAAGRQLARGYSWDRTAHLTRRALHQAARG